MPTVLGSSQTRGVTLLLAGGNYAHIPGSDALTLLLGHGCTVVMKLSPVNAYLRSALERVFVEFVDAGWLAIVEGGAQVGAHLAHHPDVDRVHMTGSAATYDALVWGTGPDAERRRASGQRLLDKPFTAELGGVNPLIVAPGRWTRHGVRRQADRIAYARLQNCGHSCAATQILILPDGWDQADLLEDLRGFLRTLERRTPYYPGTDARVTRALADQDHVEALSPDGRRYLVTGLNPDHECSLFRDEVFADVLGVVRLPAPDVESYLARAVGFANDALTGSLSATVLVDPDTEAHHRPAVADAVEGLRYGTVGLNEHAGFAVVAPQLLWAPTPATPLRRSAAASDSSTMSCCCPDPSRACCGPRSGHPSSRSSPPRTRPSPPCPRRSSTGSPPATTPSRPNEEGPWVPPRCLPRSVRRRAAAVVGPLALAGTALAGALAHVDSSRPTKVPHGRTSAHGRRNPCRIPRR